jgi:alpha-ribazole phosphatase
MPIFALRHPPPVTSGVCAGRNDFPVLDPRQYLERLLVHPDLESVARVYSSPATRCSELALLIAAHWALPLEVDERLQELDFGEWEGRTWNDIETNDQERFQAWASDWQRAAPPKGEYIANLQRRVSQFVCDLFADPVLVVTHAGPIRAMQVAYRTSTWEKVMADAVPYVIPIRIDGRRTPDTPRAAYDQVPPRD